jgi:hypothetical protein
MTKQELVQKGKTALKPSVTPTDMLQMAIQQNADLDKLEKLMELQERWEANEAKKAYNLAMSEFRKNCPIISRTRKGFNTNKFAGLAETIDEIKGLMADHGLSHAWKTEQENNQIKVTCCITHIAGHSECTKLSAEPDKSGNKNSIQAIGSTVSYLERYTLFAILGLSSKEMDDDGAAAEPAALITEEQVNQLHSAAIENEVYTGLMSWLKSTLKVNALDQIRADKFKIVEDRLNSAIRAQSKGK